MIMKQCCEAATAARPLADPLHLALVLGLGGNLPLSAVDELFGERKQLVVICGVVLGRRGLGGSSRCGGHCLGEVITAQPA